MPADTDVATDQGWERLGRYRWSTGWAGLSTMASVFATMLPIQLGVRFGWDVGGILGAVAAVIVLFGGTFGVVTLVLMRRHPQPWVNRASQQVRFGDRVFAFADFDWAKLRVDGLNRGRRTVVLVAGAGSGPNLVFTLRDVRDKTIPAPVATLLAEVVRGSSIAMPTTSNDPTGRFGHVNFPENVSREEALALIENPPRAEDRLPIGQ
ncbi:hypothetical protein [Herbiconiux sp. L3-i23]|uniref:hypothetical protein n=1 Tax=Herbiconiux sp. L3-i23 TaxID=2905871 RepID=UPI0020652EC5|nr:hypothetical protein [Herbiconiux sp. L3-i23]BDI22384.1 hypothetical protein L3i23_11600 [Herbiconiux sp. L3-i23]